MAQGLIQANQSADGRDDITPEKVKEGIQIPQEFKQAYEKVLAAGMQVMFSKESNKDAVNAIMRGNGPLAKRLGESIAGLLGMMVKQSNGTIPPQVLIPAGVTLLIEAADFLRKTGMAEINNQVIGDAMDAMVTAILGAAGLDSQKIAGFIEQKAGSQQPQPMMGA